MRLIDLTGKTFARLTVVGLAPERQNGQAVWECLCECGKRTFVLSDLLRKGRTKSCGCWRVEHGRRHGSTVQLRHGHARGSGSPLYQTWANMLSRCRDSNNDNFRNYGARGITVCERWLTFENFLADVGERPSRKHSIDRVNVEGNYEPANVRWATRKEQARNMRSNRNLTLRGETKTLAEWLELSGTNRMTFYQRKRKDWSDEKAIFTPPLLKNGLPRP
jgi:hypothetical protein